MSRITNPRMNSSASELNVVDDAMSVFSSTDKSSQTRFRCVSISPDGQQIATFSPATHEICIYSTDDLVSPISTFVFSVVIEGPSSGQSCWSIAISDSVNTEDERLLAISRFDLLDTTSTDIRLHDENPIDDLESVDSRYTNGYNRTKAETWVLLTSQKIEIKTGIRKIGGVIRFLDSNLKDSLLKDQTAIVIVNSSGIYKQTFQNSEIKISRRHFLPFFKIKFRSDIEQFNLPKRLSINLSHPDYYRGGLEILNDCIIRNHFLVNSYKDQHHHVEMYDLVTGNLETVFQRKDLAASPKVIHGLPVFAISQNDAILAFCRGTASISLYLMETGLEIDTKKIVGPGLQKIVSMSFIDDDSKLLIMIEEGDVIHKYQIFVVWDLFTTDHSENAIRRSIRSETENPLKIDMTRPLISPQGNVYVINEDGDLSSLLNHPDIDLIRNSNAQQDMTACEIDDKDEEVHHSIFKVNGERVDVRSLSKNKVIINHIEPWQRDRKYSRVSAYLHSDKRTQLTIGPDTVQVWRYRKIRDSDLHERVLEYIWAKNGGDKLEIRELLIGEREFVLKLMVPSSEKYEPQPLTIHWPNNVNVLEGACKTLCVLSDKKHEIAGSKNANKREFLLNHTLRLVKKYIKNSGLFRLTDIRYPIMENLIRSRQARLIQSILKNRKNGKNSGLHIPRLHSWVNIDGSNKLVPKKADLQIALECTRKHPNSVIVESLLDYYADNAKDHNSVGWMMTVTNVIPLLYDYKLEHLVRELFRKPCFGTIEAYAPSLNINRHDQIRGNRTDNLHVINVNPQLARKPPITTLTKMSAFFSRQVARMKKVFLINPSGVVIEPTYNDRKVYMVPLPNFTVYPKSSANQESSYYSMSFKILRSLFWPRKRIIRNVKEMSPFLRVIFEDESTDLHRTPSIKAITSYKWRDARNYFLRNVSLYVLFGISFGVRSINYAINVNLTNSLFSTAPGDIVISAFNLLFLYTGWHLVANELIQLKQEGLQRYLDIYNIFDLGSVVLPLGLNISDWLFNMDFYLFTTALSFTMLIMWFELLLLMRYFEAPGRFIYIITNILNTVWPFFAFMLIAVLGFGTAMFILLKNAPSDQFQVDRYDIVNPQNADERKLIIERQVDRNSRIENYYSNLGSSVEAVFFWTNGRWDQLELWDNYAVDVMSILGSLILVLIFQNMLIAFMNGAFDKAKEDGYNAVHVFRADLISDYETMERPLGRKKDSRYIYFIPNPDFIDSWLLYVKKRNLTRTGEEDQLESSDSDDDYEEEEYEKAHYREYSLDSTKSDNNEERIKLVDEDYVNKFKRRQCISHSRNSSLSTFISKPLFSISSINQVTSDNTLFPIPEAGISSKSITNEEVTPERTMALQNRFDELENTISERMIRFTERFDTLERKMTTVLELLSDQ
ncbi:11419_t:CDS:2 [Acaulospora morrowiae]|uniref:11419_t:CDS:1 n=1 Tax=Acaulospora morrowiae TaxID=94023 RepID=A0A9N8VMN5_9GLOM|nr:11419_t:CDS:2 [Acaulospora morrowiae]